jgi:uncharacterized protein YxjI
MTDQIQSHQGETKSSAITLSEVLLLSGLTLFSIGGCSNSSSPAAPNNTVATQRTPRTLTDSMTLKEIFFAIGTDLEISDSDGKVGKIEQRTLNFTTTFDYRDNQGNLVATAKQKMLSWGTHIDIYDSAGVKIGALQDKVFKNLLSWTRTFSIEDSHGNEIASSEKMRFFATSFTIKNPEGTLIAEISRPSFNFVTDTWKMDISGDIDKRLLIFIPSYKTHADNQSSSSSSTSSSKSKSK